MHVECLINRITDNLNRQKTHFSIFYTLAMCHILASTFIDVMHISRPSDHRHSERFCLPSVSQCFALRWPSKNSKANQYGITLKAFKTAIGLYIQ
jgi:hypothetical protein